MTIRMLTVLLFFGSTLRGFQLPSNDAAAAKVVNRFESRGRSALETLANFGWETNTPIGIVVADRSLCDRTVDVISKGESAEVVIAKILSTIPTYKWSVQDNVVVIEPREPVGPLAQLMQLSIRDL